MTDVQSLDQTFSQEKSDSIVCSVVVVSYNSEAELGPCLSSLLNQTLYQDGKLEIIVVDNASGDGSVSLVTRQFPEITLISLSENLGYTGGNNVGFSHARGRYVAVMNPDCVAHPNCFRELVGALEADQRSALATPKALLSYAPSTIDTCGLGIDASGYGAERGHRESSASHDTMEEVASVCGSCFAMRREVNEQLDGFDRSFFLYVEELDLSLRARLLGYNVLFQPAAIVHHDFTPASNPRTFYYLERNRYQMLYKALTLHTLLCLAPGLLLNELSVWAYALSKGRTYLSAKARANAWLLFHSRDLHRRRAKVQGTRRVPDHAILDVMSPRMGLAKLQSNRAARVTNAMIRSVNQLCLIAASAMDKSRRPGDFTGDVRMDRSVA
jgi:GT2 family glycosyltransferase